jgi:hypothetical protein
MNSLEKSITATAEYRRGLCKVAYGSVRISASPASSFSFRSVAAWPRESYESFVRNGVIDGLAAGGVGVDFGAEFVLEEVGWHDIDSCGVGYYHAAKQATEEILVKGRAVHSGGQAA